MLDLPLKAGSHMQEALELPQTSTTSRLHELFWKPCHRSIEDVRPCTLNYGASSWLFSDLLLPASESTLTMD